MVVVGGMMVVHYALIKMCVCVNVMNGQVD